jgi:oxygen-dependent protoporphyrinogen oxidase
MGAERFWPRSSSPGTDESLASFFRRRFGSEAFDYLIEPLVAGIYAGNADELSLEATFPRFRELEQQYGSVIKGMRATQAKAGTARKTPGSSTSLFMTLRNGLSELIQTLVNRLTDSGVQLMTGSGCRNVQASTQHDGRFSITLENNTILTADAVVLTTPAYRTAHIIRMFQPAVADLLEQIPYTSTATISMAYPSEAVAEHIRGFGFVVPRKEHRPILAGTWTSLKWPYRSQKGETLIRCYVGGRGREHILEKTDAELVESIRQELQGIVGITSSPNYTEVHRWVRGMPQYVMGHQARIAKIQDLLVPWPTLHVSGAGLYGIGIPDCIREGRRVAESLIQSSVPKPKATTS